MLSHDNELGDLSKLPTLEISAFTNFSSGFSVALSAIMLPVPALSELGIHLGEWEVCCKIG